MVTHQLSVLLVLPAPTPFQGPFLSECGSGVGEPSLMKERQGPHPQLPDAAAHESRCAGAQSPS